MSYSEEELEDHFSKYGSISEVHIVFDKDSKRSKGFAYILFALPESAARYDILSEIATTLEFRIA